MKNLKRKLNIIWRKVTGNLNQYSKNSNQIYFSSEEFGLKGRRKTTTIQSRFKGLDFFTNKNLTENATVLDIGCAEGLISYEFYKHGASLIHGFDLQNISVKKASEIFSKTNINHFFGQTDIGDWNQFENTYGEQLLNQYDIVLFLATYHHILRTQSETAAHAALLGLACRTKKYFAISSCETIPVDLIINEGFSLEHKTAAADTNDLLIFKRNSHETKKS